MRKAEPDRGVGNSATLGPLVRSDPRGLSCFYSWIRLEVATKKRLRGTAACRGVDRARKKKAQTTPPARGGGRGISVGARRVLQTVRRGKKGASNCTNGPTYGPGTAKWAQMDLARGFARGLTDNDPDRDHGIFKTRLSIPMVAMVGVGEGRWVLGSGMHRKVVPLRAPTWGKPGNCRA